MDIDAELERLSREARQKLDAEKASEPPVAKGTDDALDRRVAELSREKPDEEPVERPRGNLRRPGSLPLGAKVVLGLGAIIGLLVLIKVVLAPLLYAAVLIGVLVAAVFVLVGFSPFALVGYRLIQRARLAKA